MEDPFDFGNPSFLAALPKWARGLFVAAPEWTTDYDAALAAAQQTNKIVFLLFWRDICGHCTSLHEEVLNSGLFWLWADKKAVLLEAHIPGDWGNISEQSQMLVSKYGVSALPTAIGLDPDGTKRGQVSSYSTGTGPKAWLIQFETATKMNQSPVP